ncbi:MAG: glycosyltransferase family 87 protein [Chloroflexota bacterium]
MGRDAEAGKLVPKYIIPVKTWWFGVALLAVMVVVSYGRVLMITNNHDFAVYFKAAVDLREGRDIYADVVPFKAAMESGDFDYKAEDTVWPYPYTPVLAILLLPLSYLPYAWASVIWATLNVIALGLGCWLILLSQGMITPPRLALALLLLYGFRPALVGLRLGQIDVLIFLAIGLSFYLLKRGREGWAGALLGLAIAIKFFAAILVGYLLWKRRWRPVLWAGIVALVLVVGSYAVVGFDTIPGYLEFTSLYSSGGFVAYPYHMCFNAFFTRALTDNLFAQPVRGMNLPWLANGLTLLCSGVVIIVSCLITWGSGDPRERRFGLEYGLVVTAILLVMPPSPLYTYTWLLLPFIVLGFQMGEEERLSLWWPLLMALSYVIVARDYRYNIPIVIRFLQSHYLFGGLALWCILVAWLKRHPAKPWD